MPISMVFNAFGENGRPVKIWTHEVENSAADQLLNTAKLPFIHPKGIAVMPDVHFGIGSTVGSVIPTIRAIIPAAVGVDIGCGMNALRLSLKAGDLPDSLLKIRHQIERDVPTGKHHHTRETRIDELASEVPLLPSFRFAGLLEDVIKTDMRKIAAQLGTLGGGNHFIELCIDEEDYVWIMLHSGSRGIGNHIGRRYIEEAKELCEKWHVQLPDRDLAYLPEGEVAFDRYIEAVSWAQEFAFRNRALMMRAVLKGLVTQLPPFGVTTEAVNCHHNYIERENHFGQNVWVTRKGAIRARDGELGIIPGSMGAKSFIVRGKGNRDSYSSCSHGAGRRMGRKEAVRQFTVEDLVQQTQGVECRKDIDVLDEIPSAYKDIDAVMAHQTDLVDVVHTLRQVVCVKGN